MNRWRKGREGERQAERYLSDRGYTVLARNFRTRRGEIDLIAEKNDRIVFVEVKNWEYLDREDLEYAIDRRKQQRILATSRYFLHSHPEFQQRRFGFDVILVSSKSSEDRSLRERFCDRIAGYTVLVRIAKKTDPRRLAELKKKINDEKYLAVAISKIAQDLTQNIHRED